MDIIDRWREEREQRVAEIENIARDVAKELGGEFISPPDSRERSDWSAKITAAESPVDLFMEFSRKNQKLVRVIVRYSLMEYRNLQGSRESVFPPSVGLESVKVGCSASKSAKQIAADIRRRLLPAAREYGEKAKQWIAEKEKEQSRDSKRLQDLISVAPERLSRRQDGSSLYGIGVPSVSLSGPDCIRVKSFYCSDATAKEIIRLLARESDKRET